MFLKRLLKVALTGKTEVAAYVTNTFMGICQQVLSFFKFTTPDKST
jgi:hypothetical protein